MPALAPNLALALLLWLAALPAGAAPAASAAGAEAPSAEALARHRLLEAEYSLARNKGFYLVLELERGEIQLKARGVAFRTWPVRSHRLWGGGIPLSPIALEERSSLFAPERETLQVPDPAKEGGDAPPPPKPAPAAGGPPDLQALEVSDMPTRYTFRLAGGVRVAVAPQAQGFLPRLGSLAGGALRGIVQPLRALWSRYRGRPFATLDLVLDEADARSLYWAAPEGTPVLFWFPAAGPRP